MTTIDWAYPAGGLVFVFLGGITFWWFRGQNEQNSAELRGKIGELKKANDSLQSQLTDAQISPIVAPQDEALHLKGKIYHLEQNLVELQKLLQGQEGEKEILRQRAHRDEQEILNLQQKINILDESIKQKGVEYSDQLQALLVENDILSQCLQREVAKASDLQQQVCQIDRWRRESDESKQRIQSLGQEVIQLQETYNQAIAEKDRLAQELTQSQATIQQLNATYNQAIAEKDRLAQELTQSLEENSRLNITLQTTRTIKKEQELAYQEIRVKWEATQTQLETVMAQKKAQAAELKTLHAQIKALEEQAVAVREPVEATDPPVVPMEESVEASVESVEAPVESVEAPVESVEAPVESVEAPVESVEAPVESVEAPVESVVPADKASTLHPFDGKKIVIAGTLSQMNREEAKTIIQTKGGSVTSSPSSKTDFVVVGKAPGDKLKKAQKLGIPQLSESQFLTLLESGHE